MEETAIEEVALAYPPDASARSRVPVVILRRASILPAAPEREHEAGSGVDAKGACNLPDSVPAAPVRRHPQGHVDQAAALPGAGGERSRVRARIL